MVGGGKVNFLMEDFPQGNFSWEGKFSVGRGRSRIFFREGPIIGYFNKPVNKEISAI